MTTFAHCTTEKCGKTLDARRFDKGLCFPSSENRKTSSLGVNYMKIE